MFKSFKGLCYPSVNKRLNSSKATSLKVKNTKAYQHTVFLPKTNFPSYVKPSEIPERDHRILMESKLLECYEWQRKHVKGKEFVLHDGPPYANGKPHIGHAINKITKDIILRAQLIQGRKINYIPGWDCHGLPIELLAIKSCEKLLTPLEIRQRAKTLASTMSSVQRDTFKNWGLLADWDNQCYYTFDTKYIVNELLMFWKFYERGLIYYDVKPVFWSPSSKSALAESELVYKDHISDSVTVRFEVVQKQNIEPLYLLIWTTTPWTLPLNKAVYFSPLIKYSVVKIEGCSSSYIIASELLQSFQEKLQKEITIQSEISSDTLKNFNYKHPWYKDKVMKVFESPTIKLSGTGLLHSVPGHGHEDFILGLKNNLKVENFVDDNGCYTTGVGAPLQGLSVLEEGSKVVTEVLSSDILLTEKYSHSYPYDWRTNKPVIIKASSQWFIDTTQLKDKAIAALKEVQVPLKYFEDRLTDRPYWCVSRQRAWGVPIPVFYHKTSKRPLVCRNLIHHICGLFESSGPDIWWTGSVEELFPDRICAELFVKKEDIIKGDDIMDIWFDSGISWSFVLEGLKSELYLEGVDQYIGWFQSSLLTSVAVGNGAPFKKIMTHGFAVDENGRKMSKSLGNVIDPESVTHGENAYGVDTLRWWVGNHSHRNLVQVSDSILKLSAGNVQKLRITLRFLLGALYDVSPKDLEACSQLLTLDRYLLNSCYKFYHSAMSSYNSFNLFEVSSQILYFVPNEVSSRYLTVIKDRLYCDNKNSTRRQACVYTANGILLTLCHVIAPILPHLIEEVCSYYPCNNGCKKLFFSEEFWTPPSIWKNNSSDELMLLVDSIKKEILEEKQNQKMLCTIQIEENEFNSLKALQNGEEQSCDSELTEMLEVAEVRLKIGPRSVSLSPVSYSKCLRCRRYSVSGNNDLCSRCEVVVSNGVSEMSKQADSANI